MPTSGLVYVRQKHANAEDGKAKGMGEDASISFGIRVLAGEISAWGYYGQSIGKVESNPKKYPQNTYSRNKYGIRKGCLPTQAKRAEFKSLAPSLTAVNLAKIDICNDIINAVFDEDPRDVF